MIFKCPVCGKQEVYSDHSDNMPRHLENACKIIEFRGELQLLECICGHDLPYGSDIMDLIEHVCNTPHDWPKILVERELRSM